MNRSELFEIWAPPLSVWSRWAKPALFAQMPVTAVVPGEETLPKIDVRNDVQTAIIVDLNGQESVKTGLALAADGYRPVPLFNVAYHPSGVINVDPIARWLVHGAQKLAGMNLAPDAPPAFLLDVYRSFGQSESPGRFDNRWVIFPQDFPSADFLQSQRIKRVLLFQSAPAIYSGCNSDLAHVLLRWQEKGIEVLSWTPANGGRPEPLHVETPSRFKSLWYRALVTAGLRRNSAGGFGSVVPEPSSSHGFG